jgi:hypothetical protein
MKSRCCDLKLKLRSMFEVAVSVFVLVCQKECAFLVYINDLPLKHEDAILDVNTSESMFAVITRL